MGNKFYSLSNKMSCPKSMIVVILGSTGTGKSKLAIELAKRFNGEIISADSMQVYEGLDIVTNKVTTAEQEAAPHYLINCVEPLSRFTVVDYRNRALPIIDRILKENKLPIIVGGTNYYIESLLWEVLIEPQVLEGKLLFDSDSDVEMTLHDQDFKSENQDDIAKVILKQKITQNSMDAVSNKWLHQALKKIDPDMANMLHPQDRRKVIRGLQVYQQHGIRHSELLQNQQSQVGGSSLGGPLRFKNSVMLWLQCEKPVLNKRLDDRVDEMLEKGLIDELLDFHKLYNHQRIYDKVSPYQEGIFQSIGLKEFHEYLILSDDDKSSEKGKEILKKAVDDMKVATRQYARKQTKWVANRFLKQPKRQLPPVYGLDATDVDLWDKTVFNPAVNIVQELLQNESTSQSPLPVEKIDEELDQTSYYCFTCDRVFVGSRIWKIHLSSRRHSKRLASLKKQKLRERKTECVL